MKSKNLRDNETWKVMYDIAHSMYNKADEIAENHPKEEWNSAGRLRNAANESLFYVSQAVGSLEASATIYEWNNARKNIFSLQSMYLFVTKQGFVELEPELIVQLDKLIADTEQEIAQAKKDVEHKNAKELEPWMEKYRLWQKMQ